jgi:thiol-disulfide isomerase/thioredoxin
MKRTLLLLFLCVSACASPQTTATPAVECRETPPEPAMTAEPGMPLCEHKVPQSICVRCHPELAGKFKAAKDWCTEHDVAESQCFTCHSDLDFTPLPALPAGADFADLARDGQDIADLAAHLVAGKVTVFDFWAPWCVPCKQVDRHLLTLLKDRKDVAWRKLDMASWDTPLAKHYLQKVSSLPYLIVYDRTGKLVRHVTGLDLKALDQAIAEGARP